MLAIVNFAGYVVIVSYMAITEVPIIVKTLDDAVEAALGNPQIEPSEYRDLGAFTWWGVTLVFNIVVIISHRANYPMKPNLGLYLFLTVGINLPWTLSCVRNYIVVPDTATTRCDRSMC